MLRRTPLEDALPSLALTRWQENSPQDYHYNCIAFAAGDTRKWWEPSGDPVDYWPPGVPLDYSLASYIRAFEIFGYRRCEFSDALEDGYEKIAIFVDAFGIPSHAARQTAKGTWLSKLGTWEDIEHDSVRALEGDDPNYGIIEAYLKRPRPVEANPGCISILLGRR
jgi:hypothetical protein